MIDLNKGNRNILNSHSATDKNEWRLHGRKNGTPHEERKD